MKFLDEAIIILKSGNGGNGIVSFHRSRNNPKGGPDGGDGGRGGSIVFKTRSSKNTLIDFKYNDRYFAENGLPGQSNNKTGRDGKDLIIEVPLGTVIKDIKTNEILLDLDEKNKTYVFLEGGIGGKGNTFFLNSSRQSPRNAQSGQVSKEVKVKIELKLLADVGLVGLPSVGKSTIISKISKVRPKIADYHFTTLSPNLGVVKHHGYDFVVADVPGLIKNAHKGQGLGIKFLKHIERTKVLVHVVDAASFNNPIEDIKTINTELKKFSKKLEEKKMIYVINKIDASNKIALETIKSFMYDNNYNFIELSAITGSGVVIFLNKLVEILYEKK
jgi:GTPase